MDAGAAYAEVHERVSSLVGTLAAAELTRRVPACPDWTVQDLVAHHTGVAVDLARGSAPELGRIERLLEQDSDPAVARDRDAMTARQVAERRGRSIDDLRAEWAEAAFPGDPFAAAIAINDVVVHEGDLHEALGLEAPPPVLATSLALAAYGFTTDQRVRRAGLPALALSYDGKQRVLGEGEPTITLSADRSTLVRVLASRLSHDDISRLDWSGDPTPYLDLMGAYGPK